MLLGMALISLGGSPQESASQSGIVAVVILSVWTFIYCSRDHLAVPRENVLLLSNRRFALASIIVGIAVFLGLGTENIEAAVIKKRLKKIADGDTPLNDSTEGNLLAALNTVRSNRIPVDSHVLAAVGEKVISRPPTAQSFQVATLIADVQSDSKRQLPQMNVAPGNFVGSGYNAFERVGFDGGTIRLDTNTFISCLFNNCVVIYLGGPSVLSQDVFLRCRFQIAATESGRRLLSALSNSNVVEEFKYKPEETLQYHGQGR
jgi:hypothetical protein